MNAVSLLGSGVLLFVVCFGGTCGGATLAFNTFDAPGDGQGSWTLSRPSSPANQSFLTGYAIDGSAPFPYPIIEYRAHLSFQISGIIEPIQSAVLRLSEQNSWAHGSSATGTVSLGLFDVATDAIFLNSASGVYPEIFNDVGSGVSYGVSTIAVSNNSSRILEIPLNAAAISAIQNGTVFSVGMAMLDGDGTQNHYLFGSASPEPNPFVHELRIVTGPVPEPGSLFLLGIGFLFPRWRRAAHRSRC